MKIFVASVLTALVAVPFAMQPAHAATTTTTSVVVQAEPGSDALVAFAIEALGGHVTSKLIALHQLVATVPTTVVPALQYIPNVTAVTADSTLQVVPNVVNTTGKIGDSLFGDDPAVHGRAAVDDPSSLYNTDHLVNADKLWAQGVTGKGIDVAVLDSGVSPVDGLNAPGKVVYGPDLSFDSQSPNLQYVDGYGHGTHMAGIIASRDAGITSLPNAPATAAVGVAPDARIVSVKVASGDGATDVSQVVAGINWVIEHQHDNGLNIRVLNLSFGTNGAQAYTLDPLTYAVEQAWRHGIVVVVAAGNDGETAPLNDPAYDPFVIAVGASDHMATKAPNDDTIASFSSRGTWARRPDLAAPGRSIASLRDPGSYIDTNFPTAVVGDRFFRGSGSSQATAVTSGAVALLLSKNPSLTPDTVKQMLVRGADPLAADGIALDRGIGRLDVLTASHVLPVLPNQTFRLATGTGSINAARGTSIQLFDDGVQLKGEQDVQGQPWNAQRWAALTALGHTWSGGWWNGTEWTGSSWVNGSWASGWTGRTWTGHTWTGHTWSGRTWTGRTWSGAVWTGRTWTGRTWTGRTWS